MHDDLQRVCKRPKLVERSAEGQVHKEVQRDEASPRNVQNLRNRLKECLLSFETRGQLRWKLSFYQSS